MTAAATALGFATPPTAIVVAGLWLGRRWWKRKKGNKVEGRGLKVEGNHAGDVVNRLRGLFDDITAKLQRDPQPSIASVVLPSVYITAWAEHYKATGGNLRHQAILAKLYEEAVAKLRSGELPTAANGAKIADALEGWVTNEFYRRVTAGHWADIDWDNTDCVQQAAYKGLLYEQAVEKLRRGEIQELGHREVADAIDTWVRREFLRRITTPAAAMPPQNTETVQ